VAHERLPDSADQDADRRDADLDGRDDPHRIVHQAQRGPRARASALGACAQRRATRGDDGVLADDEERVGAHQPEHGEDAEQIAHRPRVDTASAVRVARLAWPSEPSDRLRTAVAHLAGAPQGVSRNTLLPLVVADGRQRAIDVTRTLGRSGLAVSPLRLGLAAIGRPAYIDLGHDADPGENRSVKALHERAESLLDAAYSLGVRCFDAARSCGRPDKLLPAEAGRGEIAARAEDRRQPAERMRALDAASDGVAADEV
jgi:hypothetical protein